MHKNTLYITFDGLSDPLGQSQILPYLRGIAAGGYHIHILSCEKKERLEKEKSSILAQIGSLPISWDYIFYDQEAGSFSRLRYILRLKALAYKAYREKKIMLTHCRSYLAALAGLSLKQRHAVPFIFDMRGFWADERIDGGIWKKSHLLQRFFYNYFKRKEKQFLQQADAVISLTRAAVPVLDKHYPGIQLREKITIIPCCTDTDVFDREALNTTFTLPGLRATDHLLVYTGSIGTWYYTREMIDCVLAWKTLIPGIKLLILTKDRDELEKILSEYSAEQRALILTASSSYKDVAAYLALAKAAIFFIKASYSKIASSPTKMAECWAMDLPIITNPGIGDNDVYFNTRKGGVLVKEFSSGAYLSAGREYLALNAESGHYRKIALSDFDTRTAIERYRTIYDSLCR